MTNRILLIDHHDNPGDDRITQYLREFGFETELCRPFMGDGIPPIDESLAGAVIYGGEQNVTEMDQHPFLEEEVRWIEKATRADFPLLGICLGAQLIAHSLGARVGSHPSGLYEFGYYEITPTANSGHWIPAPMRVTQAHLQQFELPADAVLLATGEQFTNQAFRYRENIFALQFHPEVSREIFQRWQDSDWAYYDQPGAQTREVQDALIEEADRVQGQWLHSFLDKVFPSHHLTST